MNSFISWNTVSAERLTAQTTSGFSETIVFKLSKMPDLADPRFLDLAENVDERPMEVVKKQMQFLRSLHSLGLDWAFSFRLVRESPTGLAVYLVFRRRNGFRNEKSAYIQSLTNMFPREYSLELVEEVPDLSFASEAAVVFKNETRQYGDDIPEVGRQEFYCVEPWVSEDNSMERISNALLNHTGNAVIDITLIPALFLEEEQKWIGHNVAVLKDCASGQTFKDPRTNRIIYQAAKIPELNNHAQNYEKMNKQYASSRLFLSEIRVFAQKDASMLASELMNNSVKNQGQISVVKAPFPLFQKLVAGYEQVDISDLPTPYWSAYRRMQYPPFRAQRLARLVSVEEASNFYRLPVPIRKPCPGFALDKGLKTAKKKINQARSILLGEYLDEAAQSAANAVFETQQLAKHGLLVGVPGSGKTTAMFNILYQLWEQKIPFIVLEPAKTEYRALKTLPLFKEEMLVFTLGDENVSPFRFNPMEVLPGIKLENHISKLQACFIGAFDLFDPLPIFLEQAIRRTYEEKGWYDDSRGGDPGLETPTLSDLARNAEYIVSHSGFDQKMRSDFQASLLERLNSLRRGSKGKMLDCKKTVFPEDLMERPVVLELDSLNGSEKSLLMMFLLSYVFEYCKIKRKSGSPLKHVLVVEEAHNLIGANGGSSENRADPKAQTIELFVNMLAEMRALGQGILIADQLPTAIAPQAVKQTNVKLLMRTTAKDDREEIGNTMDLNEEQMHQVVHFKTGHAYVFHEGEERVRMIRMVNFKGNHSVEEPPTDEELKELMDSYEGMNSEIYLPYENCSRICSRCSHRTRNKADRFIEQYFIKKQPSFEKFVFGDPLSQTHQQLIDSLTYCQLAKLAANKEAKRIMERYEEEDPQLQACIYIHLMEKTGSNFDSCKKQLRGKKCSCSMQEKLDRLNKYIEGEGK